MSVYGICTGTPTVPNGTWYQYVYYINVFTIKNVTIYYCIVKKHIACIIRCSCWPRVVLLMALSYHWIFPITVLRYQQKHQFSHTGRYTLLTFRLIVVLYRLIKKLVITYLPIRKLRPAVWEIQSNYDKKISKMKFWRNIVN